MSWVVLLNTQMEDMEWFGWGIGVEQEGFNAEKNVLFFV